MRTEILCTVGPASLNAATLGRLTELGVSLFRINLSHTSLSAVPSVIERIRQHTQVPICLDTEGAQVRTGRLTSDKVTVRDQSLIHIRAEPIIGDSTQLSFYPDGVVHNLQLGNLVSIDFNSVLVQVVEKNDDGVVARVLNGGEIGQNKAVSVLDQDVAMPALTQKDRDALRLGVGMGVRHVALSFASRACDVDELRGMVSADTSVISKIESRLALKNLREIAMKSDALLIDRGDLSRQIPIERIPGIQKAIIRTAKFSGRKVYVATNLLESMITSPTPTRAEVNDIYNTLLDGADGLVMAAETAIGKYPVGCVEMVLKVIREFERDRAREESLYTAEAQSMLMPPHGGRLVLRERDSAGEGLKGIRKLPVAEDVGIDCENIGTGVYSPLKGFMGQESLESVLHECRLPDGTVWPLPMILQVGDSDARGIDAGDRIGLTDSRGTVHSVLEVSSVFALDIEKIAQYWFSTTSTEHPGVARLVGRGTHCIAGDITLIRPERPQFHGYKLSPAQSRAIFSSKGWAKIVGFHTRNVPSRVHEHIQLKALDKSGADGLYINSLAVPRQSGDWTLDATLRSYQLMVDSGAYPRGKVVLGTFATYPRHCPARETVFSALCAKNRGCSHFVVSRECRDGKVADGHFAARELFDRLGGIGIVPLFFENLGWNAARQRFEPAGANGNGNGNGIAWLTGNEARDELRSGAIVPEWFLRPEVQDFLRNEIAARRSVFVE